VNEAAKNIVMMDLAILQAEAAAGMYKKPIEVLAREVHYEPLSREMRTVVIAAGTLGGLLPKAVVEQMVPQLSEG
jgi:pseudouridine-5'-phosphate glycosidase